MADFRRRPFSTKQQPAHAFPCVICGALLETEETDLERALLLLRKYGGRRVLLGERWVYFCSAHK